jgi:trans-aconitate methyltransferase
MWKSIDPRSFLKISFVYSSYQYLVGGIKARRLFVENNTQIKKGQKILDIGCGPGDILEFLPEVNYIGFDVDANYIKTAKEKYPHYQFQCTDVKTFQLEDPQTFDIVVATGVLHHLNDDECKALFHLAKNALKPNGTFVSLDGCYIPNQNKISKFLIDNDRGEFVRTPEDYVSLAEDSFKTITTSIEEKYFRLPYTLVIMDCCNS